MYFENYKFTYSLRRNKGSDFKTSYDMIAVHVDYPTNYPRIEILKSSLGTPPPFPLFLDQTEARRAENVFSEISALPPTPPPPLFQELDPALLLVYKQTTSAPTAQEADHHTSLYSMIFPKAATNYLFLTNF